VQRALPGEMGLVDQGPIGLLRAAVAHIENARLVELKIEPVVGGGVVGRDRGIHLLDVFLQLGDFLFGYLPCQASADEAVDHRAHIVDLGGFFG
jgi:hypothetical protein